MLNRQALVGDFSVIVKTSPIKCLKLYWSGLHPELLHPAGSAQCSSGLASYFVPSSGVEMCWCLLHREPL